MNGGFHAGGIVQYIGVKLYADVFKESKTFEHEFTGDVSKVAPIDKLNVVLVVVFGIVFLHEKLSWQVIAGTVCIVAGTLFLLHGGH